MAATDAMVALYSTTLASSATSVTISGIPTTGYRDLRLVVTGTQAANGNLYIRFNGDASTSYSFVSAEGNGSVYTSYGWEDTYMYFCAAYGSFDTSVPLAQIVDIFDYAQDKHKTAVSVVSSPARQTAMGCSRWANTAAITSILVSGQFTTFSAGTTIALYGIKA